MQISKSVIVCYYVIVSQSSKLKPLFINDIADGDRIPCPVQFNRLQFELDSNFLFSPALHFLILAWNWSYCDRLKLSRGTLQYWQQNRWICCFSLITHYGYRMFIFFINDVSFSSENMPKLIIIMNKFARMAISKSYDSFYLHDTQRVSVDCKLLRS